MGNGPFALQICTCTSIILLGFAFHHAMAHEKSEGSSLRLAPDSDLSYEEEYQLFMEEEDDGSHLSRQKRFIYLNVDTNMAVALLIGVPLTFVLPSMSNLFNSWRRKRSIDAISDSSGLFQGLNDVEPETDKVSSYFQLLDIPESSCQLRAVCEFSADPDKFYPLSDVILKRIRNPDSPSMAYQEGINNDNSFSNSSSVLMDGSRRSQKTSLQELYNQAADEGQAHGFDQCHKQFANSCHYPIEKLLNMPVIKFWSALQALLKLSFKDVALKLK